VRTILVVVAAAALLAAAPVHADAGLPGFTPDGVGPSGGTVYRGVFPSTTAPQPLRAGYVYLPPGFTRSGRYPVVYLLHGMPGDPTEYVDALGLARVADTLVASAQVRPFVAVLPAAGPTGHYNGEWAGPWEQYLVGDVIPWVDSHLPVEADRAGRTIAGLSAGGYGAMDVALRSPLLFGRVESWSGYFHPLHDGPFEHARAQELAANDPALLLAERARQLRALGTRFFVGTGPSHSHWFKAQETVAFARELRNLALPHTLLVLPDAHGQYAIQLEAGLRWALAP
jgi:S-formylglutathione hydrolase FrmB